MKKSTHNVCRRAVKNSTAKVRAWRAKIKAENCQKYEALKEKDKIRKREARKKAAAKREVDTNERNSFRRHNRLKKRKQREAIRLAKCDEKKNLRKRENCMKKR